ncbi:MAG: tRNA (adenosine(37)-N6)-threonylcarbamoyltransferase complex ATPase subunit type 1 TsaE [Spirochaetales bacterium]|nr:tRNA (adenosine(37)-N6)-threonylcarbamoyltransferase complex ATPase subunit type 1 TsaE [Spirochaetales bacterium]
MSLFKSSSPEETESLGRRLGEKCRPGTVIGLQGSLGAGKTVFTRGFARGLEIEGPIVSPSYTIVQQYSGRLPLYHMDLYRIADEEEFLLLGAEEMLYGKGVCLIEWFERADSLLPEERITVEIQINEDQTRTITIQGWEE